MKQTMREMAIIAVFLLALISAPVSQSFTSPSFRRTYCSRTSKDVRTITSFLQMSSSEENNNPSRRRRKRKDGKNSNLMDTDQENLEREQYEEQRTVKLEPVQLKVQDIRNLASGNLVEEEVGTESKFKEKSQQQDSRSNSKDLVEASSSKDSSLEALLADARRMRENEASKSVLESEEPSIPKAIKSVISTIVTVDFFVVCALLVWFLAGIFCSYVLKDDTVQIAFNGIFQPVVQPALGILMIGSAAGAAFGDPKEE